MCVTISSLCKLTVITDMRATVVYNGNKDVCVVISMLFNPWTIHIAHFWCDTIITER